MSQSAIVAGTGFEGRAPIIRRHCKVGAPVFLVRERANKHDENAVAVYMPVPRFFGL
ncbi:MAG: HIRAN domain-containing protein, partial [Guyparkeria sp.]